MERRATEDEAAVRVPFHLSCQLGVLLLCVKKLYVPEAIERFAVQVLEGDVALSRSSRHGGAK
jgi:hypothetical protein